MNAASVVRAMRPRQWIKNFMVYPALVFSGHLTDVSGLVAVTGGFVVFCLLSGAVYLFNDIRDFENDRAHPNKRFRPIASGELPIPDAWRAIGYLVAAGLGLSLALNIVTTRVGFDFLLVCAAYLVLQIAYTLKLKHVVILDVGCIAAGFVLRVMAGTAILNVPVGMWIVVCTTLLALFLGFGKRRHELVLLSGGAGEHRKILEEYSPYYLDQMIAVVTASTVIAYSLYTLDPVTVEKLGTAKLPYTIPFVIYGIFRYLYLVHQKEEGGSPSKVLISDRPLLLNIALWFLAVVILLYVS
ncbi:MAG: decaprenyl-phosphate phosphoribosyltransferase [Deltaproteobacteria bacterium]|nr:decaprenyl-phosphate phosphoribosyltransferase [Deltaproteobacteria bacterium]